MSDRERVDACPIVLRLMASVHRLVLTGAAPELAAFYPSVGGSGTAAQAWPAFRSLLTAQGERIAAMIDEPLQTNEVGRTAAVVLGLVEVATATGLPLRLLEIGSSAGLLLNIAHYRFDGDSRACGPADSPVVLRSPLPAGCPTSLPIVEARGCDTHPLDVADATAVVVLRSATWPDQSERLARLDAAIDVARAHPPRVDRADAAAWLRGALARDHDGVATVVLHSVVWQYLDDATRHDIRATIEAAGGRASVSAPLAWLRFEHRHPDDVAAGGPWRSEVRLTQWPGGTDRVIARAGNHGAPVTPIVGRRPAVLAQDGRPDP